MLMVKKLSFGLCAVLFFIHSSLSAVVENDRQQALENYEFLLQKLGSSDYQKELNRIKESDDLEAIAPIVKLWKEKVDRPEEFKKHLETTTEHLVPDTQALTSHGEIDEDESHCHECLGKCGAGVCCCYCCALPGCAAGAGIGALVGMPLAFVAGAMTGLGQSMSADFSWNLIWIIGGSVWGGTTVLGALGGTLICGGIGCMMGPEIWNGLKQKFMRQKGPLSYDQIIATLGEDFESLSPDTHDWLEKIYNELIKELPVEEV